MMTHLRKPGVENGMLPMGKIYMVIGDIEYIGALFSQQSPDRTDQHNKQQSKSD